MTSKSGVMNMKNAAEKQISFLSFEEQRHGDWIMTTSSSTCSVPDSWT
jgi:hypothetical protein